MGVYIKGMEMPGGCFLCILSFVYFNGTETVLRCNVLKKLVSDDGSKDPDCPLTKIPQHGRLIDADKIGYHSGTWEKGCDWVMQSEIALMPTVIPADNQGGDVK